jgi:hypothetical protein
MLKRFIVYVFVCSLTLLADVVVLRSGKTVEGTYLGGDSRRVRMAVGDGVQSFGIDEISSIRFGDEVTSAPTPAKPAAPKSAGLASGASRPATGTASATAKRIEVPAGTALVVRMIDDVDSERDSAGQTFRASVDEAVVIDGQTLIPRGADVIAKLVEDKEAGKLTGRSQLTLDLQSVVVNGRAVDVATGEVTQQGESRTRQTATRTGGGAALGAIIGAIAGGGKGAAIGAVTGAAAGGAVQVLTKGPTVRIPSETRLTFTLTNPLVI